MMEQDDEFIDKSSKVGKLIQRINQLQRRNVLDNNLGEILDSFLQYLVHSEDYFRNGIFKINFIEAALLIQSSALIYSKKVDLLWDVMNEYQKHLISFRMDDKEIELQKIEERETKYKRKMKQIDTSCKKIDIKPQFFLINMEEICDLQNSYYEKDSKLYSGWYTKIIFKWHLHPDRTPYVKEMQFRSPENAIFDMDQDNEFTVHTSKMESAISLEELLIFDKTSSCDFSFKLYSSLYIIPKFLKENQFSHDYLEKNFEEVEKYLENCKDEQFLKSSMYLESCDDSLINKHSPQKLGRMSVSANMEPTLDMSDLDYTYVKEFQENFSEKKVDIDFHIVQSTKTGGEEDVENNIFSTVKLSDYPNCVDQSTNENETLQSEKTVHHKIPRSKSIKNLSESCAELNKIEEIGHNKKATRNKKIEKVGTEAVPEKRRKYSKAALRKLATGICADLDKFNSFYALHYKPEEGEGQLDSSELIFDHPIDSSSRIGVEDATQLSDHPILNTQDSGYDSHIQDQDECSMDCDFASLFITDNPIQEENLGAEYCASGNHTEVKEKPLYQQLFEWKQYISEKFKNMNSTDFDIHKYGSNIMENFGDDLPQKFSDIVRGKSSSEVTRYFISALQLANTSNVEIQGVQCGKLSNETFELKLISRDRYYDRLKEYMAPSQQYYSQRLNFVHNLTQKRAIESARDQSNDSKRNKYK